MLLVWIAACLALDVDRNCERRRAWYPDEDGDGLGERTAVFIGCEAPEGWVSVPEPEPETESGDSGETDPP